MLSGLIETLRANRERLVDELVAAQVATVPSIALLNTAELRANMDRFFDDAMRALEHQDVQRLTEDLSADLRRRFEEGFSLADYVRAVLLMVPVARRIIRDSFPAGDASFVREFAHIEELLHGAVALASNLYVELVSTQLLSKNRELNRLNRELGARERALSLGVEEANTALQAANEFNHRVIDSLTSGLIAVEAKTLKVTLYTRRAEEILGVPAEAVLGRSVRDAVASIGETDFDFEKVLTAVRAHNRLPLTKVRLNLLNGRTRSVYLRGERMFGIDGQPEGTVVLIDDVTERELLVESFARYVSRDLLTRLLARGEAMGLEGERRVCTILFADIRGFTALAERIAPEALHELLNSYFAAMIDAIVGAGGFIDKFVGDKIMAIFSGTDAAEAANSSVRAATAIQARMAEISRTRTAEGLLPIQIGIGLNTGEVLLGNVGSTERMDFTAIGDVVNVADRIQALAAAGEILLGEHTAQLVEGRSACEDLGERTLRGRNDPIRVFRLTVR